MSDDTKLIGAIVVVVAVIAILVFGIYAAINDARDWSQFKIDHECKVIRKTSGYYSTGHRDGKTITLWTPGTTTWACNDGVEYVR